MSNTFVGGAITNTAEIATNIVTQNVAVDLNGTFATSDLQHFDSPSNGRLRHLGSTPRDFLLILILLLTVKTMIITRLY